MFSPCLFIEIRDEHTEEQWIEILDTALEDAKKASIPDGIFRVNKE